MTVLHLGVNNCFAVKKWPMPRDWAQICSADLDIDLVQFSFDLFDPRIIVPEKVIEAIEGSDARTVHLIVEIVHAFEAEERQVLQDLKTSVEYWKQSL